MHQRLDQPDQLIFQIGISCFCLSFKSKYGGWNKISKQERSLQKQRGGERKYGVDDIVTNNRSLHTLK
ncbi:TPA: hypothetical protein I7701_23605 [Vibrio vulnificus]|nr:hypothetical protein [Vibrio vulnificus]